MKALKILATYDPGKADGGCLSRCDNPADYFSGGGACLVCAAGDFFAGGQIAYLLTPEPTPVPIP